MLKGFVSGEEKDIVRIPMKGQNLFDGGDVTVNLGDRFKLIPIALPAGLYTLSYDYSSQNTSSNTIIFYNENAIIQSFDVNGSGRRTCVIDSNQSITGIRFYSASGYTQSASYTADFTRIMLNLGSTPLPYEPYGYQNGWEVRDNQDRLIWGREDTLEGTDSIPIKGYGTPLTSVTIKGNGQQNGTPSPQNILPFDGTGERTGNLFDKSTITSGKYATLSGASANNYYYCSDFIPITATTYYFQNVVGGSYQNTVVVYDANKQGLRYAKLSGGANVSGALTFQSGDAYIRVNFYYQTDVDTVMLNLGSTALPYEPYGYKIPLTAASVTTPLYLGEVSTTRRIKKLVLTGEENWTAHSTVSRVYTLTSIKDYLFENQNICICTHYQSYTNTGAALVPNGCTAFFWGSGRTERILYIHDDTYTSATDFKAYLQQQYAAGTPVCVWYVLATPQTGITNEPLCRIGDYYDTLTTDTPIPTTTGATDVTVDTKIPPSELTIKVHAKKIRYGFKIDKSQENSESAVIYTHDAVTMTPAVMDFTNDRFSYGSWENAWFVRDARPCALKTDGTVDYYLDPNDATKKLDGTPSDIYYELLSTEPADWSTQWKQYYQIVSGEYVLNDQNSAPTFATNTYYKLTYNSSFTGNFMVEFPQVWFKRYEDSSYNYIEISNYKLSDDWKCYSHINKDGTLVDRIYLPMFKGVIVDNKLRSLPGQIPQGNTTATVEVNAATALGSRWQIWDHSSAECLNDLLTLMSKSIDSQGRFGQGRSTGYDSTDTVTYGKLQTGTLIKKGKFHGYSATTKEVKVFGIEGFWANRWDRLQGMLLVNNVWQIKMTPPYNFTGTDFVTLSNAEVPSENGYLSKVQTSEYGSIPASVTNGSSTKYFKDYFYKSATGTRVARRGGHCNYGGNAGFRYVHVSDAASASNWYLGASPVYK